MSSIETWRPPRTIWYMGAKARIIPGFLENVLERELSPGDTVVDLMSGTGIVSAFCARQYRVFSNDAQDYARTLAASFTEHSFEEIESFLTSLDFERELASAYEENLGALGEAYARPLAREAELLGAYAEGAVDANWAEEYRDFLASTALYPLRREPDTLWCEAAFLASDEARAARRADPLHAPASLVTSYYANVYYGLRQAVAIDSLRAAIARLEARAESERSPELSRCATHWLAALLHAASVSTSGTSHFAQPRQLTKDSELLAMAKRRVLDPLELLLEYSGEIARTVRDTASGGGGVVGNRAFAGDYRQFLEGPEGAERFAFPEPVDLVYLDPPYTSDNYSRFYHVLEVLVRYDYPELEERQGEVLRGRYPRISERFRSGFCSGPKVEDEFRRVISASARSGAKVVISYSDPSGLLLKTWDVSGKAADGRLCSLLGESYRKTEVLRQGCMHSGQGDSNIAIDELLIVGTKPRG